MAFIERNADRHCATEAFSFIERLVVLKPQRHAG